MPDEKPVVAPVSPKGFASLPAFRRVSYLKKNAILLEDLVYVTVSGEKIIVPSGFETDFASIPELFWNLPGFDSDGPAAVPAILHDFLYSCHGYGPYYKTRYECDRLLLEAMQLVGMSRVNCQLIYWNVRLFGGFYSASKPWNKDGAPKATKV